MLLPCIKVGKSISSGWTSVVCSIGQIFYFGQTDRLDKFHFVRCCLSSVDPLMGYVVTKLGVLILSFPPCLLQPPKSHTQQQMCMLEALIFQFNYWLVHSDVLKPALIDLVKRQIDKWPGGNFKRTDKKITAAHIRKVLLDPSHGFTKQSTEHSSLSNEHNDLRGKSNFAPIDATDRA